MNGKGKGKRSMVFFAITWLKKKKKSPNENLWYMDVTKRNSKNTSGLEGISVETYQKYFGLGKNVYQTK